jgi:hypothetical protein
VATVLDFLVTVLEKLIEAKTISGMVKTWAATDSHNHGS